MTARGYCLVRCQCGHQDDFEAFTTRPVTGDLPRGSYQCPKCGRAWQVVANGEAKVLPSGFIYPPPNIVVTTHPVL